MSKADAVTTNRMIVALKLDGRLYLTPEAKSDIYSVSRWSHVKSIHHRDYFPEDLIVINYDDERHRIVPISQVTWIDTIEKEEKCQRQTQ